MALADYAQALSPGRTSSVARSSALPPRPEESGGRRQAKPAACPVLLYFYIA
jgi:hypothetical protein